MLRLAHGSRIFMAVMPVDMRRSFNGLCATITEALGGNPLSGDVFLFRGKRADRIKAIAWDRTGLAVWYKRLEKGKYKWSTRDAASIKMTGYELALLLDGVDFTRIRRLPAFFCMRRHHERCKYLLRGLSLVEAFGKISTWLPLPVIPPI